MPNPKTGTVTFEVAKAVKEIKAGKVEFRLDKTGTDPLARGQDQFSGAEAWRETRRRCSAAVVKAKPAAAKGQIHQENHADLDDGPGSFRSITPRRNPRRQWQRNNALGKRGSSAI